MTKKAKTELTLNRPVTYQIKVPGKLNENWLDWDSEIAVIVKPEDDSSFATLTGSFNQAALQGLLRRLYSQGIPLVSVICLEFV